MIGGRLLLSPSENILGSRLAARVMRYRISDASGALVAIHCRQDGPDGKRMWWEQPDGTSGLGGLPLADLPLYGIERLNGSPTVILVEGEKAAEALLAIGVQAVGTVTGASGTPGAIPLAELTGRRVRPWPDNDGVGRSHMTRIGAALVGIAADEVRLINWPDAPEHGDAADFIAVGGTREDVEALIDGARPLPRVDQDPAPVGAEPWELPLSLERSADLAAFPVGGLPDWLRSFVLAEAEATQTPVDMASMFVLAALATVVAGHVVVEPVAGWREGLNVFVVVAMEPGSRKSAVHRDVISPIVAYERMLVEQAAPDIAEQATIRRIAEASLAKAEKTAASATDRIERLALEDEARTLSSALDRLDVPSPPRLFTADVTPEKLASLLHENGGRMAVLSAEGGIFDIMAGRYSSGMPNIDVYLAGHAGDPIRVDRRGRPPEFVDRPALTIGLAVQPYVLAKAARVGDFAGRGLLDRFLYSIPTGTVGYRQTGTAPVPEAIRQRYDTSLRALAASFDRFAESVTLHLSIEASALFTAWRAEIEPRRRPDADLGHIAGWSSKLDGAVVRIAGLLHLAETFTSGPDIPISAATMAAALEVGGYLIDHAIAAFDAMGADPRLEAARRIGRWIVATHKASFTKREAFRALRGQALFPTIDRLTAGLAVLDEHGWVRGLAPERGPGRPPSRYETNPAIFLQAWTKWPELTRSPEQDDVLSILSMDSERIETAVPEPDGAVRKPDLLTPGPISPLEPTDLGDWFAAPLREPTDAALDEWGTLG
jgi:replicative DNA helicase